MLHSFYALIYFIDATSSCIATIKLKIIKMINHRSDLKNINLKKIKIFFGECKYNPVKDD